MFKNWGMLTNVMSIICVSICIKVRTISAEGENLQLWQQKPLFSLITPGVPLHRSPWVVGDLCWKEMWSVAHNWYIECLMELGVAKVLVFWSFPSFLFSTWFSCTKLEQVSWLKLARIFDQCSRLNRLLSNLKLDVLGIAILVHSFMHSPLTAFNLGAHICKPSSCPSHKLSVLASEMEDAMMHHLCDLDLIWSLNKNQCQARVSLKKD